MNCVCFCFTAPTAVTELTVVAVNSTALRASWDIPVYPNGPLSHYMVYYREFSGQGTPFPDITSAHTEKRVDYVEVSCFHLNQLQLMLFVQFALQSTPPSIVLGGLDPFTNYSVIVRAVGTEGGPGLLTADSVRVNRTYTTTDTPPTIVNPTTDSGRNTFVIQLPDPDDIDTGPVMYVM